MKKSSSHQENPSYYIMHSNYFNIHKNLLPNDIVLGIIVKGKLYAKMSHSHNPEI